MALRRLLIAVTALALVCSACGDDDDGGGGDTTTTADAATTTTLGEEAGPFDESILPDAIAQEGDAGLTVDAAEEHTLDIIWPETDFPDERAAYEDSGFESGMFTTFTEGGPDFGGFSAAHLFADTGGAETGFGLVETWHRDLDNVAAAMGAEPGDLTDTADLDVSLGDESVAFVHSGEFVQAAVVLWRNGNVVHIVRGFMATGDQARVDTVTSLADAINARM